MGKMVVQNVATVFVNRSQAVVVKHVVPVLSMGEMVGQHVATVFANRKQATTSREHCSSLLVE